MQYEESREVRDEEEEEEEETQHTDEGERIYHSSSGDDSGSDSEDYEAEEDELGEDMA